MFFETHVVANTYICTGNMRDCEKRCRKTKQAPPRRGTRFDAPFSRRENRHVCVCVNQAAVTQLSRAEFAFSSR